MPIDYQIDPARRLVVNTATGHVSGAELLGAQRSMVHDPDFDSSFSQILDLSALTSVDVTAEQIRSIAALTAFSPTSRRAHVVTDPVQYGLLRMFQAYAGDRGGEIRLFTTRAQADRWIDGHDP